MTSLRSPYTVPEAEAIIEELTNIDRSLTSGEREKQQLLQCLSQLRHELQRLRPAADAGTASEDAAYGLAACAQKLSIASQTDLSSDVSRAPREEMARDGVWTEIRLFLVTHQEVGWVI